MNRVVLSWNDCQDLAKGMSAKAIQLPNYKIYAVPRGGIPVALLLAPFLKVLGVTTEIVDSPLKANLIVDDLVESGATRQKYSKYSASFLTMIDKTDNPDYSRKWVVFPWEKADEELGPTDAVTRLIEYIGDDPKRDGLKETPARVICAYDELFSGYDMDPAEVFKTFDEVHDEMVVLRRIEFSSFCEHHMLPFVGEASIAYIPNKKVIGVSKLARLLEVYSRRLQIQERLTSQVRQSLDKYLDCLGSACVIKAKHMCMSCRGVNKQQSEMITSSLSGAFQKPETRAEFFQLAGI